MSALFLRRHPAVTIPGPPGSAAATVGTETAADSPAYQAYSDTLGIDIEKGTTSFDARVRKEYRFHTAQYWFVATLANGLLWAQIVIGAALTALGATRTESSQTATIYLGAASTVIAGLLTYFKSRNQPNRARQLRQALRGVRNKIDDEASNLADLTPEAAREVARGIMKKYNDALAEAAANYPDLWMTMADLKKYLPGTDPAEDTKGEDGKGKGKKADGENGKETPQAEGEKTGDAGNGEGDTAEKPPQKNTPPPPQPKPSNGSGSNSERPPPRIPPSPTTDTKPHTGPDTKPMPRKPEPTSPSIPPKKLPQEQPGPANPMKPDDDRPTDISPLEKELSDVRDIAGHIDLDADFSHPDEDTRNAGEGKVSETKASGKRVQAVAGLRKVGGFTLLE